MSENNTKNVIYFENKTMGGLYHDLDTWQNENKKRYLQLAIQHDNGKFCCICLTNPSEVTIVGPSGHKAEVHSSGRLYVD
ncbi:TPA: hypothetical protein N2940_004497 [Vibrio parahaemolyticus]|uniref:hypothetical protein n=1 Tax=Vibrio parahaemolyticus TaxID=670 RepID=UPI00111CC510|nr:hypothetical protein [Vibrio parahaemolyticus]MBE3893096.1 hypothetical protein [Vibrio parahaemolyticus]TOD73768.1 hypothetical protein CGJ57_24090 [Vibrio parahaemolyticus]HCG9620992.1 hypothetical protein [Vibrio parahaemolyticus]HCM1391542.1 hypothetical protein [Vibrio parahaemolyticus]